ncbi:MAG TPA: hypothetical protein VGW38_03220 [Chloroflexota bacterium]|nr:hypothetical protein [Chloroflexota bacterium]
MASRLYRTTRRLYQCVEAVVQRLHVSALGTPTLAILIAWSVTGLILLAARPTQTRVARMLPGRCHAARHRRLRTMPLSTRALTALLRAFAKQLRRDGYLVLDEVMVEQAYAKRLPWAASSYSFAKKRKLWGFQIVVLWWCSGDGHWRIPVGFRLWRPKRSCAAQRYRTTLELALELVTTVVLVRLPAQSIVGDTHDTAGWFTKRLTRLGLTGQGTSAPKTIVVCRKQRQAVRDLAVHLKLRWRKHLGVRATALTVFAPKYGHVRLVVTSNRHGNDE